MEGNDENNAEFALNTFQRINGWKIKQSGTAITSPLKVSFGSPSKSATRLILKPFNENSNEGGVVPEQQCAKRKVTSFGGFTDDTIVTAKTFVANGRGEGSGENTEINLKKNAFTPNHINDDDKVLSEGVNQIEETRRRKPEPDATTKLSRPLKKLVEFHYPTGCREKPVPPSPPPPMPSTTTTTNEKSKRRSASPASAFPEKSHSVKRIRMTSPKPDRIYPGLTAIETEEKTQSLLQIITEFTSAYTKAINETLKPCGGNSRISYIFHETFEEMLSSIDPVSGLSQLDILTAKRNVAGPRAYKRSDELYKTFELLVKRQICRLEEPSLKCVELVHEEMQRIVQECGVQMQLPNVYESTTEIVTQLLKRGFAKTNEVIREIVAIELAYINIKHPDFHLELDLLVRLSENTHFNEQERKQTGPLNAIVPGKLKDLPDESWFGNVSNWFGNLMGNSLENSPIKLNWQPTNIVPAPVSSGSETVSEAQNGGNDDAPALIENKNSSVILLHEVDASTDGYQLSDKENRDCEVIRKLIKSYFSIVKKTFQAGVPKTLKYFLVNYVRDNLQSELVSFNDIMLLNVLDRNHHTYR